MKKKDFLIWTPVIIIAAILYHSVMKEEKKEVEEINSKEKIQEVKTVKKDSFIGIEDEDLNTAIDKIDPEAYRKKEQLLLKGRHYTIDTSFSPPLRRVVVSPIERDKYDLALKSLNENAETQPQSNKPDYGFTKIILDVKKNPKFNNSVNHKKYELRYTGINENKDITLLSNTTNFENSVGNLNVDINFDYSNDLYKAQRDFYIENGTTRNQETDVYPENYIIESLEQTVKLRLDGVQFTKPISVPDRIVLRTQQSPTDFECILEKSYFSNIGSSFNADYTCDALPNIGHYEGSLEIIFKR